MENLITFPAKKIALCIIFGNEETIVERMLDSFAEAFDELCAVRAVGNVPPDGTLQKIRAWALANNKDLQTGDYLNTGKGKDRPHVDDFGEARNLAFDLAKSEWCFWADCDDVMAPGSAAIIRQCVGTGAHNLYGFDYFISDMRQPVRERLVRKGKWRWELPVHETMYPVENPKEMIHYVQGAKWIHLPEVAKRPVTSHERNSWILENMVPACRTWFAHYYLAVEKFNCGKKKESHDHARIALADSTIPVAYQYELLMNYAKMAEHPAEQRNMALNAYQLDPSRREALAHLALWELGEGSAYKAVAFARAMMVLPTPPPGFKAMNHEAPYYGWVGLQIMNRAIRAFGQEERALHYENEQFKKHEPLGNPGGKITLVHATRGRVRDCLDARMCWYCSAKNPIGLEHIFVVDDDDKAVIAEIKRQGFRLLIVPAGGGSVAAWNAGAKVALGDVVVQCSDDFIPPQNWDEAILSRIGDTKKPAVLGVSDGIRPDGLTTIAIATKARIAQQEGGTLFSPEYKSVFSDDEFYTRAQVDGCFIPARDLVFLHNHPISRGIPVEKWDKTYQESNSKERYEEGIKTFRRRNQGYLDKLKELQEKAKKP